MYINFHILNIMWIGLQKWICTVNFLIFLCSHIFSMVNIFRNSQSYIEYVNLHALTLSLKDLCMPVCTVCFLFVYDFTKRLQKSDMTKCAWGRGMVEILCLVRQEVWQRFLAMKAVINMHNAQNVLPVLLSVQAGLGNCLIACQIYFIFLQQIYIRRGVYIFYG